MAVLFEKSVINGMELKNRLVRSATHEGMADEAGFPTPALFKLYQRLAKGGVGLIITGYAYVSKDGKSPFYRQMAMDRDELIPKYRELVDLVHQNGAKIAMQIAHCGRQTREKVTGSLPMAPSAVIDSITGIKPREMTEEDIARVIESFAQAARRVKEAGFDGVQLHCAHGYLLHTFLCPHTNRRTDRWGGSTENRVRIMAEIYSRCRELIGRDFPLMVKYSAWDRLENGLSPEEGVLLGQMMAGMGYDCLEISAGIGEDGGSTLLGQAPLGSKPPQAFNLEVARALKRKIQAPVMLVGGLTDPAVMENIVQNSEADYISLCRALISEPALPRKIQEGKTKAARCLQCNLCMGYIATHPLHCYYGKMLKDAAPRFKALLYINPQAL